MLANEKIFNVIKKERQSLDNFKNYKVKISNSDTFSKQNLMGVYKIRQYTAARNGDNFLSKQIANLLFSLENYSKDKLRFVSILGKKYYGMFFLSENWDEVIGYLEREIDENEFTDMNSIE